MSRVYAMLAHACMHTCAAAGEVETVEYLLYRGADPNLRTRNEISILDLAISARRAKIVRILLLWHAQKDQVSRDTR